MDVFFYFGAFQSFFFALLIGSKKKKSYADKILVLWLFVIGIHLLNFLYFFNGWHYQYPLLIGYGAFLPTTHGPLFYLYFKALVGSNKKLNWRDLLHFSPFAIAYLLILQFMVMSGESKLEFLESQLNGPRHWSIVIGDFLNNTVGPVYIIVVLYLVNKHQQKIKDVLSNTENVSLQWIKNLAYGLAIIWIVVLAATFQQYLFPVDFIIPPFVLIYVAVVLFVFSIGYFGFKQTSLFTDFSSNKPQENDSSMPVKYEKSGLTDEEALQIKNTLVSYIEKDKPYLDNNLNLEQVTSQLNISRHWLSQVINDKLNTTFFDLINEYRVEEFKKRIINGDAQKFTVLGIALDCGFNSKASFNRVFKNQTGITPSSYISSLKKSK